MKESIQNFSLVTKAWWTTFEKKCWIDFDLKKKIFKNMALKSEAGIFKAKIF